MKKKLAIFFLILFMGIGTIFTGCNTTDLSEINAEIDSLKQQITSLNQTITDLQTRLNESEENQDELLLDLTTAKGQLAVLEEQVFGKTNEYNTNGDTFTYVVDGSKVFDLTFDDCVFDTSSALHRIPYTFTSHISSNIDISNTDLLLAFVFYDVTNNTSYETRRVTEQNIIFTENIPDEIREGFVYIYSGNTIISVFDVTFNEIASH